MSIDWKFVFLGVLIVIAVFVVAMGFTSEFAHFARFLNSLQQ